MIAHWEARTTDYQKKAIELSTCMMAFNRLVSLWDEVTGEERLTLARGLFEYIVFDLDQKKITDFRLHAWADQYLILRGDLYDQDDDNGGGGNSSGGNKNASPQLSDEATCDPSGKELEHLSSLNSLLIEFLQCIAFPQNAQFALLETS